MELTAERSYSSWNSLSKLEKEWNLQWWSTKTQHSAGVFYFGLGRGGGSKSLAHFYGSSLAMTFEFSKISKTKLTSVEYSERHFLNHPGWFFWNNLVIDRWTFCSRCWDRYPVHCTGLKVFPKLLQNKICYILHPKYTSFFYFLIICTPAIWKSLF